MAGDENYQKLWEKIHDAHREGKSLASVKCPQCLSSMIQCVHCTKTFVGVKNRRTAAQRLARHVRKEHPKPLRPVALQQPLLDGGARSHQRVAQHTMTENIVQQGHEDDFSVSDSSMVQSLGNIDKTFFDAVDNPDSNENDTSWGGHGMFNIDEDFQESAPLLCSQDSWDIPDIASISSDFNFSDSDNSERNYSIDPDSELFDTDLVDQCLAAEREKEVIEDDDAEEYIEHLQYLDLNPDVDEIDPDEDNNDDSGIDSFAYVNDGVDSGMYSFQDFAYFDTREPEEKRARKGSLREKISQNQLFFWQKYKQKLADPEDDTGGLAGLLVYRANAQDREETRFLADAAETKQMFLYLNLLLNSAGKLKQNVVDFSKGFHDLFDIENKGTNVTTNFPKTMKEAKSKILDGTHSMMKNFPCEKVFNIGQVACVSLKEKIYHLRGLGADLNHMYNGITRERNMDGLNGTDAASDLIMEMQQSMRDAEIDEETIMNTSLGWLIMWSDSFLRCFIKQRENSIWILTITICPPEGMKNSKLHTHVLAIGKGSDDHQPVIEYFLNEMKELQVGEVRYCGKTNTFLRSAYGAIAVSQDRPERQKTSCTRQEVSLKEMYIFPIASFVYLMDFFHSQGNYGKITGAACNVSETKAPSCLSCYMKRIESMVSGTTYVSDTYCVDCCDWDVFSKSPANNTDRASDDYPSTGTHIENAPEGREPGRQVLPPIKLNSEWLINAIEYAYSECWEGNWTKANLDEYIKTCNIKTSIGEEMYHIIKLDKENGKYAPRDVVPKIWQKMECFGEKFKFPDVPMHAVGHGIGPDVMHINHQIFSHHKKLSSYIDFANPYLSSIQSFRLSWCKIKTLPKAAWVGENSMAYMRLMPYIYGMFFLNNDHTLGPSEESKYTVQKTKCVINAFSVMLSSLMSKREVEENELNDCMKLFMSATDFLHSLYGRLNRKRKSDDNGANSNGRKRRKRSNEREKDPFIVLKVNQLKEQLRRIGVENMSGRKAELIQRLNTHLLGMISEQLSNNLSDLDSSDKTRIELENMLRNSILTEYTDLSNGGGGSGAGGEEVEKKCWNKGNWLSILTNIASQIQYLGILTLLW